MQLVYLCPAVRKPVGGVKVIYAHAKLANALLPPQHEACVLHPNTWRHTDPWFDNGVPQMRQRFKWRWVGKPSWSDLRGVFSAEQHRVVLPELWARKYGRQLAEAGVPYAIYVQNGYFINKGDAAELDAAYAGATCVLGVSDDTLSCVRTAFPFTHDKLLRVHVAVDAQRFRPATDKTNTITYMPRKLPDHVDRVLFFLRHQLPSHWSLQALQGLSETQVAEALARSKVFLSFSHFEGLGLPPLEAAFSGNRVVGYTGEGGKEYWQPPVFEEVHQGDILGMVRATLSAVADWDAQDQSSAMADTLNNLRQAHGAWREEQDLRVFCERMGLRSAPT